MTAFEKPDKRNFDVDDERRRFDKARADDAAQVELHARDAYVVPPGHDAHVVGEDATARIEVQSALQMLQEGQQA